MSIFGMFKTAPVTPPPTETLHNTSRWTLEIEGIEPHFVKAVIPPVMSVSPSRTPTLSNMTVILYATLDGTTDRKVYEWLSDGKPRPAVLKWLDKSGAVTCSWTLSVSPREATFSTMDYESSEVGTIKVILQPKDLVMS